MNDGDVSATSQIEATPTEYFVLVVASAKIEPLSLAF
jgi:hypothetical protein